MPHIESDEALRISEKFNVPHIVAKILCARGFSDEAIEGFLCNDMHFLYNPFLLNDMQKAVDRINEAACNGEKVAVYGDYDVDGITATYIMYDYLCGIFTDCIYYIPNRLDEGYGINTDAIDKLKDQNVSLIITVDVGITAISEVEYAKSLGIDVIITDHHELKDEIPDAVAVINPKIRNANYPFDALAGVGVAFKLIYAHSGLNMEIVNKYSDMAAIGTIADMVPLFDENRFIASLGIEKLRHTSNKGLRAIMSVAGISQENLSSADISFAIAPRLNAAGRMTHAGEAVELLLGKDTKEAYARAEELDACNRERQNLEQEIFSEATHIIEKNKLYENNFIMVTKEGWAHGVIGIVSSKITDKYYKPSAVVSINEDGSGKASGRSIKGINLFEVLNTCSDNLTKFGGHELAAGFTVKPGEADIFYKKINSKISEFLTDEIATPYIEIDCVIEPEDVNLEQVESLHILEPYGIGNRSPVFCMEDVIVESIRYTQNGKHAFLTCSKNGITMEFPAFSMTDTIKGFGKGDYVHIAGTLGVNTFRGTTKAQFVIRDIKFSEKSKMISRKNLETVFSAIKSEIMNGDCIIPMDKDIPCDRYEKHKPDNPKISTILRVFEELKIINISRKNDEYIISKGINFFEKNDLFSSETFRKFNV